MHVQIELQKKNSSEKASFELFNVDAGGFANVMQCQGRPAVDLLIHKLARAKMPVHLYSYDIVNWELM